MIFDILLCDIAKEVAPSALNCAVAGGKIHCQEQLYYWEGGLKKLPDFFSTFYRI